MNCTSLLSNKEVIFNGPLIISPNIHEDNRGYFFESWNRNTFNEIVGEKIEFVQDNQSKSSIGVLRGLHYQLPPMGQGKLVRATKGLIFDVIVDLRTESPTFAQWGGVKLDQDSKNQLWVPIGFAHGFLTLSNYAIVEYKVTNFWSASAEKSLRWNDKDIQIEWPKINYKHKNPLLSPKDHSAPQLFDLKKNGELFL
tara:strand:+ start:921 stop:1511 length:591 start_codon:yes stop_codon:yes gene_type:complete